MRIFLLIIGAAVLVAGEGPVYSTEGGVEPTARPNDESLTTQTVYGFLDFTTTIANTVMVFSPQSQKAAAAAAEVKVTPAPKIEPTKVPVQISSTVQVKTSPPIVSSRVVSSEKEQQVKATKPKQEPAKKNEGPKPQAKSLGSSQPKASQESKEKKEESKKHSHPSVTVRKESQKKEVVKADEEENNLDLADSEVLAKEPSERIGETYKIVEPKPTKVRNEPTGLVTKLGGTVVKEGTTTVHETSVIGTYIGGKYAQVLKATSHIIQKPPQPSKVPKGGKESKLEDSLPLEALFTTPVGQNLVRQTRRPAVQPPFKNRIQRTKPVPQESSEQTVHPVQEKKNKKARPFKLSHSRFNRPSPSSSEIATVSVFSEPVTPSSRRYHRQRSAASSASAPLNNNIESGAPTGRRFKPKPSPSQPVEPTTSLYKFKLSRPQGRWQYKTTPKPRVAIRRQDEPAQEPNIQASPTLPELDASEAQPAEQSPEATAQIQATPTLSLQTIKVEISTPANFSNVYYEIATIKSPYTFQVGTVKNTRFITLTSTFEKLLEEPSSTSSEPLTENILSSTPVYEREGTVVTLPVIAIAGSETLPLETMTDIFSTSEILLKTHLLPVVKDSNTTTITLVQTYEVTKVVSATKTLPPTELFQFIPSKTLNEFNTRLDEAGSELHLELEFGDNDNDEEQGHPVTMLAEVSNVTEASPPPPPPPTPPPHEQLTPEKLQQLALLRFLNPNQPPVVTSTPVISVQTLFETHVLPVFNGLSTVFSTISRPVKTLTNTQFMTTTLALPSIPLPLFPSQQPQPLITSSPVITQTVITQTDSKVLKLTFGAKTAYTTLYSTKVIPTILTTYQTTQLAIQPTIAPFPSFFPPFNPFNPINPINPINPYVG